VVQVCNAGTAQKRTSASDRTLVNTLSRRCLDGTDTSSANGTRLQIRACAGSEQQKWTLPGAA